LDLQGVTESANVRPHEDRFETLSPLTAGKWLFAGTNVTGQSHEAASAACDDAWFCGQTANGFAIGVVSDGAGSAPHGGLAAEQICKTLSGLESDLAAVPVPVVKSAPVLEDGTPASASADWSKVLRKVRARLIRARKDLARLAARRGCPIDDFWATVICVVAHPRCGAIIFHIGDGAASVFRDDGTPILTSQPENGAFLNETYFLVEDDWENHCRVCDVADIAEHSIFLMTDGVTDLAYHREGRELRPEPGFFRPLIEYLAARPREAGERGLHGLLSTERAREMVDDDKTIVWMKFGRNDERTA
jgi:hypothetical protein